MTTEWFYNNFLFYSEFFARKIFIIECNCKAKEPSVSLENFHFSKEKLDSDFSLLSKPVLETSVEKPYNFYLTQERYRTK